MVEIRETEEYGKALKAIRDTKAVARILTRIRRLSLGNPGDVRDVGEGVSEMRIDHGPGYRVYYCRSGKEIFLLLTCGDKSTQDKDIKTAIALKAEYT